MKIGSVITGELVRSRQRQNISHDSFRLVLVNRNRQLAEQFKKSCTIRFAKSFSPFSRKQDIYYLQRPNRGYQGSGFCQPVQYAVSIRALFVPKAPRHDHGVIDDKALVHLAPPLLDHLTEGKPVKTMACAELP